MPSRNTADELTGPIVVATILWVIQQRDLQVGTMLRPFTLWERMVHEL
jgi:hypothetical protein